MVIIASHVDVTSIDRRPLGSRLGIARYPRHCFDQGREEPKRSA